MSNIKHIVFDIGQVLVHWDPETPFRSLIPSEERRNWFLTEVCSPAWNLEQDRGRDWRDAEDELIAKFPSEKPLIRAYRQNWTEMISHALEASVEIMDALIESNYDVTLLTNFNQETFPLAKTKYPFLNHPRGATVSGEIGLIKPDREIYDYHVKKHELDPAAILFFDDNQHNIIGARDAGWNAELFVTPKQLATDLTNHNIKY